MEVYFHKETKLLHSIALPSKKPISKNAFQKEMLNLTDLCERYTPKSWLIDYCKAQLPNSSVIQVWFSYKVMPVIKSTGISQVAFVIDKEDSPYINDLFEEFKECSKLKEIDYRYFFSEQEASLWLTLYKFW